MCMYLMDIIMYILNCLFRFYKKLCHHKRNLIGYFELQLSQYITGPGQPLYTMSCLFSSIYHWRVQWELQQWSSRWTLFAGFSLFFHVVNIYTPCRVAEHRIMVLLGYHVELVWYYVEDKSHHHPLACPWFTSCSKTPAAQEVPATL